MFHRDLKKYTQRKLTHTCTHAYLSSTYVTIEANRNTSDIGTKTYPIVVKIFLWISVISCRDKSPHTIFCIWVWSLLRPQLSPSHKLSLSLFSRAKRGSLSLCCFVTQHRDHLRVPQWDIHSFSKIMFIGLFSLNSICINRSFKHNRSISQFHQWSHQLSSCNGCSTSNLLWKRVDFLQAILPIELQLSLCFCRSAVSEILIQIEFS